MNIWHVLKETLMPIGRTEFKAHLTRLSEEEASLVRALHLLDKPASRGVRDATDEAAEFVPNAQSH